MEEALGSVITLNGEISTVLLFFCLENIFIIIGVKEHISVLLIAKRYLRMERTQSIEEYSQIGVLALKAMVVGQSIRGQEMMASRVPFHLFSTGSALLCLWLKHIHPTESLYTDSG